LTNRLLQILNVLILFEVGVILLYLPWANSWQTNYFIIHYPVLRPYLLHPAVRGAVSGLGALDILMAAGMVRRRPPTAEAAQTGTQTRTV
jgi:hypothetical protein